ncbi:type I-F CRISPR-associated protein Csy2 [Vibrio japonicus]|uniref:Type I-F CRISPR-associated protein Csy2 n=1 Tax=Vibrio japonicus TaxID=1824638 RepID=A0ABY5LP47_9VIBR|nr:type I-F CRISPR-associated protein Csy2 [Vibrio japonicus]UUM32715.1 type I-F CRISPR-associated protein Csy2 [Vibrio japonicus]
MQYLVLKHIRIANANAISGLTWGFPAVSHFLGFTHALSRKAQNSQHQLTLTGCGIVCHQHQVHCYRDTLYEPYGFALTRNPLTKEGKTAPIVEEGRMHLTVSLIIECEGLNTSCEQTKTEQLNFIKQLAQSHKLAGGTITAIHDCYQLDPTHHKRELRKLLPGFVLADASSCLAALNESEPNDALQHWLDFSALKYASEVRESEDGEEQVSWERVAKPFSGYLVPVQIGYKKIAPTFAAGEVANVRDSQSPVSFVESVYSVAEWIGSPSRINSLRDMIWQYRYHDPFYVCHTASVAATQFMSNEDLNDDF